MEERREGEAGGTEEGRGENAREGRGGKPGLLPVQGLEEPGPPGAHHPHVYRAGALSPNFPPTLQGSQGPQDEAGTSQPAHQSSVIRPQCTPSLLFLHLSVPLPAPPHPKPQPCRAARCWGGAGGGALPLCQTFAGARLPLPILTSPHGPPPPGSLLLPQASA